MSTPPPPPPNPLQRFMSVKPGATIERTLRDWLIPLLAAIVVTYVVYVQFNQLQDVFGGIFKMVEAAVLIFVAFFSALNFQTNISKLEKVTKDVDGFRPYIFLLLNFLFLLGAVFCLLYPHWHLLCIAGVYAVFSYSNIYQTEHLLALKVDADCMGVRQVRIKESSTWLTQENGPAMIAYAIMTTLMILGIRYAPANEFKHQLEAFAGGAAAFHLFLSVIKFRRDVEHEDVFEVAVQQFGWDEPRNIALAQDLAQPLKAWKRKVGLFLGAAALFCIVEEGCARIVPADPMPMHAGSPHAPGIAKPDHS